MVSIECLSTGYLAVLPGVAEISSSHPTGEKVLQPSGFDKWALYSKRWWEQLIGNS